MMAVNTDKFSRAKAVVQQILEPADVILNGDRPWDIRVHDPRFYRRVLAGGSLALGESYMDGWWDCPALDRFFTRILRHRIDRTVRSNMIRILWHGLIATLINPQPRRKAHVIGEHHYDTGNDLFEAMLDPGLNYSCGYWAEATSLEAAQIAKNALICRKLGLEPGMKVLDIGCGWGGFARYAVEKYHVSVDGITVSKNQVDCARQRCEGRDITIELKDYRALTGSYDRVVSIGMFEHVGYKNYRIYMDVVRRSLKEDGLFLLHTIGGSRSCRSADAWISKYIFPRSMLPSARQISGAVEGRLVIEDWHNFGSDYDRTLIAWHRNVTENWDRLKDHYDDRFFRMWTYYLLACAGSFRARKNQVWQIVFSKHGMPGGFRYPRN